MTETAAERIRLDKWLKSARIAKTRSVATQLCDGGKVKVNGVAAKPARLIGVGDRLEVQQQGRCRRLLVEEVTQRSVPARDARLLYTEQPPTPEQVRQSELDALLRQAAAAHRPRYKGRPTKRERRRLDQWKK